MEDVMKKLGLKTGVEGKTRCCAGLGTWVTRCQVLPEGGTVVIALAEYEGAIMNPNGLNEEEVFQHRKKPVNPNFPGATNLPEYRCPRTPVRYPDPRSPGDVINGRTPQGLKLRSSAEATNGPCTPNRMKCLRKRHSVRTGYAPQRRRCNRKLFRMAEEPEPCSLRTDGKTFQREHEYEDHQPDGITHRQNRWSGKIDRHGADEQELVHSGLEETMIAPPADHGTLHNKPGYPGYALLPRVTWSAINKVATSYVELGIFPINVVVPITNVPPVLQTGHFVPPGSCGNALLPAHSFTTFICSVVFAGGLSYTETDLPVLRLVIWKVSTASPGHRY